MTDKEFNSFIAEIGGDFAKAREALDAVCGKADNAAVDICKKYIYEYERKRLLDLVLEFKNTRDILRALRCKYISCVFTPRVLQKILDGDFMLADKDGYRFANYQYVGDVGDKDIWCIKGKGVFD